MRLTVVEVEVPAMSTVGIALGVDENNVRWMFAGDHRPMAALAEALGNGEEVIVEVGDYQVIGGGQT